MKLLTTLIITIIVAFTAQAGHSLFQEMDSKFDERERILQSLER